MVTHGDGPRCLARFRWLSFAVFGRPVAAVQELHFPRDLRHTLRCLGKTRCHLDGELGQPLTVLSTTAAAGASAPLPLLLCSFCVRGWGCRARRMGWFFSAMSFQEEGKEPPLNAEDRERTAGTFRGAVRALGLCCIHYFISSHSNPGGTGLDHSVLRMRKLRPSHSTSLGQRQDSEASLKPLDFCRWPED